MDREAPIFQSGNGRVFAVPRARATPDKSKARSIHRSGGDVSTNSASSVFNFSFSSPLSHQSVKSPNEIHFDIPSLFGSPAGTPAKESPAKNVDESPSARLSGRSKSPLAESGSGDDVLPPNQTTVRRNLSPQLGNTRTATSNCTSLFKSLSIGDTPDDREGPETTPISGSSLPTENDSEVTERDESLSSPPPSQDKRHMYGANVTWKWEDAPERHNDETTYLEIRGNVRRDLNKKEKKPGFVYALRATDPQGYGRVKIGLTGRIDESRMEEHKRCYGRIVTLYPPKEEWKNSIKHAARVEKLVHAELAPYKTKLRRCPGNCRTKPTSHTEWFQVSEDHAIAVIKRWIDWVSTLPYEEVPHPDYGASPSVSSPSQEGGDSENENAWKLKSQCLDCMHRICVPLESQNFTGVKNCKAHGCIR